MRARRSVRGVSPTNTVRPSTAALSPQQRESRRKGPSARREILIRVGPIALRARLCDTPTADLIWQALPIYSTAETWGGSIHFETPIETGRESGATATVTRGDIMFWVEEDCVVIAFGPTPISRPGEMRLPAPCNVWAVALDDVTALAAVQSGARAAILEADS